MRTFSHNSHENTAFPYEDLLYLPHHTSDHHPRMSMTQRAAQFSPFAALSGYGDAIDETGRFTEEKLDLEEDVKAHLNEQLQYLAAHLREQPEIAVTYFRRDDVKSGGETRTYRGRLKKIDAFRRRLLFSDGNEICLDDIYKIQSMQNPSF